MPHRSRKWCSVLLELSGLHQPEARFLPRKAGFAMTSREHQPEFSRR